MNSVRAISTNNLSKRFGHVIAVNNVNLSVNEGEIYALIGPNGAGKTTLLKMLVGLLTPTSGSASMYGNDIIRTPVAVKRLFGYVSDDTSAYEYLTGKEFLILTGRLRGLTSHTIQTRIRELLPIFPIDDIIDQPMSAYSRGNKQKVAFLSSILATPKILVIDEPIVGMDAASIDTMGKMLRAYAKKGNSILIVTHILDFAEQFADCACIMIEGKIVKETPITKSTSLEKLL